MEVLDSNRRGEQRTGIQSLSNELCVSIFEYLPSSALASITQTCSQFHSLSIALLYHTVDLSVHHYKPRRDLTTKKVQRWPDDSQEILVRQYMFIVQLLRQPELASLVRNFTWSIGIERFAPLPRKKDGRVQFAPYDEDDTELKDVTWLPERVYQVFHMLTQVTAVDIDTGPFHGDSLSDMHLTPSSSLFPNARHVRLGGKMHYALASSILHGNNKAPLRSLCLNNVQEGGIKPTGENLHMSVNQGFGDRVASNLLIFEENWPDGSWPVNVAPGNMRRLLNSELISRCQNVEWLHLHKQGQQASRQYAPGPATHEEEVYREWAAFIEAVRPPTLMLSHRAYTEPPEYDGVYRKRYGTLIRWHLYPNEIAPMDKLFRDIMAPVLRKGWPGLKQLKTEGVSKKVLGGFEHVNIDVNERLGMAWNGNVGCNGY